MDLTKTDTLDAQFARGFALDNRGAGLSSRLQDCFFHVEDTTGGMGKTFQREFIQRVEFASIARIIVFLRMGRANVPSKLVEKGASGTSPNPTIATLPRRYEFVFDGAKVAAAPNNPPLAPPLTSYSVGK